jgi:hypothetical protein
MINKNTKPTSPFRTDRSPKLPDKTWRELWKSYTDNEKVYILLYLNKLHNENGDRFIIEKDDPFNDNEIKYIKDVLKGRSIQGRHNGIIKQSMKHPGFDTPETLDATLMGIMESVDSDILGALKETDYFEEKPEVDKEEIKQNYKCKSGTVDDTNKCDISKDANNKDSTSKTGTPRSIAAKFPEERIDISNYPKNAKDVSHDALMKTAKASDVYSKMDEDLSGITGRVIPRVAVSGKCDSENASKIISNAKYEARLYAKYLAGDTATLLRDHIDVLDSIIKDPAFKDVDAASMNDLVVDSVQKLVYQEIESNKQQFTDHGIRHIVGNIVRQDAIATALNGGEPVDARQKLMSVVTMVNHDIGYTTPLIREGGLRGIQLSGAHEEMSASILSEQKDLWDAGKIFTENEFKDMVEVTATHSATTIDKDDIFGTSVRLSDNLSLFETDKLPGMFEYVEGGPELLMDLGEAARLKDSDTFDVKRTQLYHAIDNSDRISDNLKRDLKASVKELNLMTPKFTMGSLAGEIEHIGCDGNCDKRNPKVLIDIKYNDFDRELQSMFDMGQKQTKKLLGDYGITDFSKDEYDLGGVVTLRIKRD